MVLMAAARVFQTEGPGKARLVLWRSMRGLANTYLGSFVPFVKAHAATAEDPGFESRLCRDFSGIESNQ